MELTAQFIDNEKRKQERDVSTLFALGRICRIKPGEAKKFRESKYKEIQQAVIERS